MEEVKAIDWREFGEKGKQIYERIRPVLEPEYRGKIVAIEPESGDYFIGDTISEAGEKAREKHPDKVFYFAKIGYKAVHVFRGPR